MSAPVRLCTICNARYLQRVATHVATLPGGFEWFECGEHDAEDHARVFGGDGRGDYSAQRTLTPIDEWFRKAGLLA
jgi:hypothetical protein